MKNKLIYPLIVLLALCIGACTAPETTEPVKESGKVTEAIGMNSTEEQPDNPAESQITPEPTEEPVHVHSFLEEVTAEASCDTEGVLTATCSECGEVEVQSIPVKEHMWKSGEITLEPTCGTDGIQMFTCEVCGIEKEDVVPATGEHIWNEGEMTIAPTCVTEGVTTFTCITCGTIQESNISISEDHIWNEGEVTKPSNCAEEGARLVSCTLCDATKTEVVEKDDSHIWDEGKITKKPTCGANGTKTFLCTVCNDSKTQSIKPTGEHSWDNGKVTKEATCYREGIRTFSCTNCKEVKTEAILTTDDHSWNLGTVTKQPTKTTDGVCVYTCYRCQKTKEESTGTYYYDASDYRDSYHIRSTNNPDCYLDFSIKGNMLTVSGKIIQDGLEKVWVRCGENGEPSYASSGQLFTATFSLNAIAENTMVPVTVYTKTYTDSSYWGYSWDDISVINQNGEYRFSSSLVLEHNLDIMSRWVNPESGRSGNVAEEFVELSNQIVGDETDDYKKIYLLNYWVAENIYYDYDYYYGKSKELYYSAEEVMAARRSVCGGYANFLQKLIQAQGIPCIQVTTYSAGASTKGYFDETNYMITSSNHAHVEAFVDGRWVTMDATWDSQNKYENGQFMTREPKIRFFDSNLGFFSYSHKLIRR